MSSNNIYTSPLCSCIICRATKSAKGIHSHYIGAHGTKEQKASFTGLGQSRTKSTSHDKQKAKAAARRIEYAKSPNQCRYCNSNLVYNKKNQSFCSSSCMATYWNARKDYTKFKTGPSKGYKFNGRNLPKIICDFCQERVPALRPIEVFRCCICKTWSKGKESRKLCGKKQCRTEYMRGRTGGFRINSTKKHRSVYNGYQMDSGAELAFAKLLDAYSIKWHKNTTTFFTYDSNRKYYPDFYLPDFDAWIEIKGKYYFNEVLDPLKWASIHNLEVIWSDNIKLPAVCTGYDPVPED